MIEDTMFDNDYYALFVEQGSGKMAINALNALPTHREESQRTQGVGSVGWIPCSERLPRYDETSEYIVTDKGGRIRHCLLDPYMPESFVTVEEGMIVDAVAWRQAPEPYCKTESHEREVE